jgi:hypothetical protein
MRFSSAIQRNGMGPALAVGLRFLAENQCEYLLSVLATNEIA